MNKALAKALRTPLRYPGGKSRATKTLFGYFPHTTTTEYYEPFIGGGSMAIEFTRRFPNIPVTVSDYDPAVYAFWKTLRDRPVSLQERLLQSKAQCEGISGHRKLFETARELLLEFTAADLHTRHNPIFDVAHAFFIVNKCGFSGLMSGGFSEQASQSNFSVRNISNLVHYGNHIRNWNIYHADANDIVRQSSPDALVYLDPPYAKVGKDGKSFIYGKDGDMHKSFNHDRFAESVAVCESTVLMSYDNNDLIKSMYPAFNNETFDLTYTMHSGSKYREEEKERKELVLWNYDTAHGTLETFL
jgi:DNA adenine methylase Dam